LRPRPVAQPERIFIQNKLCLQAFSFGGSNDILKEAVVSDLLKKTETEWWQQCEG